MMGWMPQTPARPGAPAPGSAPGQPPAAPPAAEQAPPAQPAWNAAPPAQPAWNAAPPQPIGVPPGGPVQPAWGAPPQAPAQPAWGAPPEPPAQPAWGAPPGPPPAYPPGPPPAYPPGPPPAYPPGPPPAMQPAWGAPPNSPPPAYQPPPAQPAWGAPPAHADHGRGSARPIAGADATHGMSERARFIRLTYLHLFGAILLFAGLDYLFMTNDTLIEKVSAPLVKFALGGRWNWGVVLAVFAVVSWVADYFASHVKARPLQYVGLGLYVLAEALIFVPLLAIVEWKTHTILARGGAEPHIIRDAAFMTLAIFGALTASVLVTKKDFSFLRSGLAVASAGALMLIVLSLVFGFNLGIVFSVAMVLLAAGYILFQTSQVLAHYDPDTHVAAALALFSSIALMFWYVIRILMKLRE